jgi:hypothetical protein
MSHSRRLVVLAMMAVLLGGHLICIVLRKEAWPFSNYPMYSWLMPDRFEVLEIVALPLEPHSDEFPLANRNLPSVARRLQGFDRLVAGLHDSGDSRQNLASALGKLHRLYETHRLESRSDLPSTRGLALYKRTFERRRSEGILVVVEVSRSRILGTDE